MCLKKLREEFSHTVLHGEMIKKNLNLANAKPAAAAAPARANPSPRPEVQPIIAKQPEMAARVAGVNKAVLAGGYDPVKMYKAPVVVRRSNERALKNSTDKNKPVAAARAPSVERTDNQDVVSWLSVFVPNATENRFKTSFHLSLEAECHHTLRT